MSSSTDLVWDGDGRMFLRHNGMWARVPVACIASAFHYPTPTFWCTVQSEWGNTLRQFDTGLHDYNDAKKLVETLHKMGEL